MAGINRFGRPETPDYALGPDATETDRLLVSVALDGMTKARRAAVELLATSTPGVSYTTAKIGDRVGMETGPISRALADLAGHGVVERIAERDSAHSWQASDWLVRRWKEVSRSDSLQMSMHNDD